MYLGNEENLITSLDHSSSVDIFEAIIALRIN